MTLLTILLSIVVSAQLDSTQLMIGDQCDLRLQAVTDAQDKVQFPVYGEELIPGIEITDRTIIDTTSLKDGRVQLTQYLTITSFKDSLFFIPPVAFTSGEDTFLTDPLSLNVIQPFEIDSADNAITDIKGIYKAPVWWWGIIRWILLALGVCGLGVGAWFLARYIQKRRSNQPEETVEPELLRPAEEVALEKLDKIKEEKIWQQGRQKDYHTALTDTVREYIARRYAISSQEQTSSEILADIQPVLKERKDLFADLKQMLSLADLVKFAKWNPLPDENEKSLRSAYNFVRETTPQTSDDWRIKKNSYLCGMKIFVSKVKCLRLIGKQLMVLSSLLLCLSVSAQTQDTLRLSADELQLQEVSVTGRRAGTVRSRTSAFDTQRLNSAELCKAACCNLSESFETNASVDVAYSDAATGAKQIRLLGLQGTYVQLLTENTPGIRGLAQTYGMEYIPGPWMDGIQISKGTASVINGYEATTGQINIEYLKPKTTDPIAVNLMLNSELHSELNLTGGWQVTNPEKSGTDVSTALLAHAQYAPMQMDANDDSFRDMPTGWQANVLNRWDIFHGNYTGRILIRGIYDKRESGQITAGTKEYIDPPYLIGLNTRRIEGFMKNGYVIDPEREMSVGIITALSYHDQDNTYGNRLWQASQLNAYLNAIFAIEPAEGHKLTAGLSLNFDRYRETLNLPTVGDLSRQELTPGIFAEYSFQALDELSLLAGVRMDYSTRYGVFFTPRMNLRYAPWEWWHIRASFGLGYRSPNLIADNAFLLPSSRKIILPDEAIRQERALNTGISTTFYIPIKEKELQLSAEYYYTRFFDCLLLDLDTDPHSAIFSNLNAGRSFAQSAQIEASMEVLRGWTITAAFRYTDIRQTIGGVLREKPLTPRYKGLLTTSYRTPLGHWQFDLTAQLVGSGRLPDPDKENPLWQATYKPYPQLMGQVTKFWRTCSLYLGAENMTNYKQTNPIIDAEHPFSGNFDASMVYAPVSGWKIYLGFRWNLKKAE